MQTIYMLEHCKNILDNLTPSEDNIHVGTLRVTYGIMVLDNVMLGTLQETHGI